MGTKGLLLIPCPRLLGPVRATPFIGVIAICSLCRVLPIYLYEPTASSSYDLNFRIMLDLKKKTPEGNMK